MKFLLDTDTCIHVIRQPHSEALRHIQRHQPGDIGISSITLAELAFGVMKSSDPERNQTALEHFVAPLEVPAFDSNAALTYGQVREYLERAGTKIGSLDLLIGAHALTLGVTLVTHNTREFSRIKGLRLADWIGAR
jgi:tRNA(fMet)-specific endonuclease VapC